MSAVAYPDAYRARLIDRIRVNVRNARVPGGDVAAWVAPLSTGALQEILAAFPRHRTLEVVFATIAHKRGIAPADVEAQLAAAPPDNVADGFLAQTTRHGWRMLLEARDAIEAEEPHEAIRIVHGLTRWLPDLPRAAARRFEPTLCALYAEADRMRERQLADEVA